MSTELAPDGANFISTEAGPDVAAVPELSSKPLNVLVFTSLFPNAGDANYGIFILQRVRHFADRGHRVTVVAPVPFVPRALAAKSHFASIPRQEVIADLEVYHPRYLLVPKVSMPLHGWLMFRGAKPLAGQLHAERKFDLIDAHYAYPDGFAATLLARRLALPLVISARGSDLNRFPSFRTIRPQIRWSLEQADGVVAVSRGLQQIITELGISAEKVRLIGNGIDGSKFFPEPRSAARQKLAIAPDAEVVVCVAGLVAGKGHELLLKALAETAKQRPQVRLYLVGKGILRQQLTQLAAGLGIADKVAFVGPRPHDEIRYWFSAADLSCLFSEREGSPNAVAESLACGCPVVLRDIPALRDALPDQQCGMLSAADTRSLAEALGRALDRKWDRTAIARVGGARSWQQVAAEVEDEFRRVLALQAGTKVRTRSAASSVASGTSY